MRTFKDNQGRSWSIEVNVAALKRVKTLAGVDLMEVLDGTLIDRLIRDPVLLGDVLFAVCKPEADSRGISDEDFGRALAGDAIESATTALLEEIVSFCPSPRDRKILGQVVEATMRAMDKARDVVETRLKACDLDRLVAEAVAEAERLGDSSTGAQESSESTQAA